MKILITGGAGFLGLHLGRGADKKYQLYLLDIADFDENEYPKNCHFIRADIRHIQLINKLYKEVNPDCVVHAAAALPLWPKEDIFAVNVEGTKNLLEAALKNKVKHFIYISSTAVYGVPKKHPIDEDDPLVGVGPYGQSKIAAEKLCEQYRKRGLLVTVIRPKTFVGTHRLGVFEILFDWVKEGKRIPIIGSGNNRYQLLDVDDLVESIYLLITYKNKKKINTVFNIGAEKFKTVKEDLQALYDYARVQTESSKYTTLLRSCQSKSQLKPKILPTPGWLVKRLLWLFEKLHLSPLYQWVYDTADCHSYVSINRLIDTLHWHPKFSNAQALIKAYQWYLDNYREIKARGSGVTHTVGWKQGILGFFKRFL
jgi:nucleoside-diphosphate-sugar epimerase